MKSLWWYLFLIWGISPSAWGAENRDLEAIENVMRQLIEARGDERFPAPLIRIESNRQSMASYYPKSHTIVVEALALEACRSLGDGFEKGLAFLIGHELHHAFERYGSGEAAQSGFAHYNRARSFNLRMEQEADIYGILTAQLAGYPVERIVPALLNKLYAAYEYDQKPIPDYPTLEERMGYTRRALTEARHLQQLHQAGAYLSLTGAQDAAGCLYDLLKTKFRIYEVYHNAAVAHMLEALSLDDPRVKPAVYPFELEWSGRLAELARRDPSRALSIEELVRRKQALVSARQNLNEALNLHGTSEALQINDLCLLLLEGQFQLVLQKTEGPVFRAMASTEKLRLVRAIALYSSGSQAAAIKDLAYLNASQDPGIQMMVRANRRLWEGNTEGYAKLRDCSAPRLPVIWPIGEPASQYQLTDAGQVAIYHQEGGWTLVLKSNQRTVFLHVRESDHPWIGKSASQFRDQYLDCPVVTANDSHGQTIAIPGKGIAAKVNRSGRITTVAWRQ